DHRGNARPPEQPGKRHLRPRYAARFGNGDERVDNRIELFPIVDRWLAETADMPAAFGFAVAPILSRQQSTGQRRPDENAEALILRDRHQFVFGVAAMQRIMDLLG